ncbi:MAG: hypothetical protein ACRD8A_08545 [Candidatus Acidiferrales bacterium]
MAKKSVRRKARSVRRAERPSARSGASGRASSVRGDVEMLRHTVATLAYRGGKAFRGAPVGFAEFRVGDSTRTPGQILAHLGDLLDWALSKANGAEKWHNSATANWENGSERFFAGLQAFDARIASSKRLGCSAEELFQGPVADSLTHVGQIAMLRRLAGAPVRAENYAKAKIEAGRVSSDQPAPVSEFD